MLHALAAAQGGAAGVCRGVAPTREARTGGGGYAGSGGVSLPSRCGALNVEMSWAMSARHPPIALKNRKTKANKKTIMAHNIITPDVAAASKDCKYTMGIKPKKAVEPATTKAILEIKSKALIPFLELVKTSLRNDMISRGLGYVCRTVFGLCPPCG